MRTKLQGDITEAEKVVAVHRGAVFAGTAQEEERNPHHARCCLERDGAAFVCEALRLQQDPDWDRLDPLRRVVIVFPVFPEAGPT
ncbi:hypothetical protein THAOC_37849, partial [Thalassiosira oceanica]